MFVTQKVIFAKRSVEFKISFDGHLNLTMAIVDKASQLH